VFFVFLFVLKPLVWEMFLFLCIRLVNIHGSWFSGLGRQFLIEWSLNNIGEDILLFTCYYLKWDIITM